MKYQNVRKPIVIFTAVIFHCLLVFHMLLSPVIIVLASNNGIINASFFSFIFIFVLSLFFGRAYCAWFCPGCGVQELAAFVVKKKAKNSKAEYIKYVLFFIWISVIITGYILKGFRKIDFFYCMSNITIEKKLIMTLGALIIIVPLAFIFGKFASCKYICIQAPFMIIGKRIRDRLRLPGLRIKINADNCKKCGACTSKCPKNIDVIKKIRNGEIYDDECIYCGTCIDACRFNALRYCISTPNRNNAESKKQLIERH